MLELIAVALATFWAWETVRYAATEYVQGAFAATRALHPLVVAAPPVLYLWPEWVDALAVAAVVGILHLAVERFLSPVDRTPVYTPQRRTHGTGLPPLP